MGDFLMGRRGLVHSPYDVMHADFDIDFIAKALSRQGRYLGHGNHYLSVAEHSVLLSYMVPQGYEFVALMHDAPEAFVGDVHSKIKSVMEQNGDMVFRNLEKHFWGLIASKYGLVSLPLCVHELDIAIRKLELESLHGKRKFFCAWSPQEAEDRFLDRAFELAPEAMDVDV